MKKEHLSYGKVFSLALLFAFPFVLSAQSTFFSNLVTNTLVPLLGWIVVLFVALGVIVFIWGMVKFIGSAGNETERQRGVQFMVWGVVGLFVMISVWGFVNIVSQTFFSGQSLNRPTDAQLQDIIPDPSAPSGSNIFSPF